MSYFGTLLFKATVIALTEKERPVGFRFYLGFMIKKKKNGGNVHPVVLQWRCLSSSSIELKNSANQ